MLLLVSQSLIHYNCSISVSYPSSSNVKWKFNSMTLETEMTLFKRVELGQETIKSLNEFLPISVIYEILWIPSKKCNQTDKHQIFVLRAEVSRFCQLLSAARRITPLISVFKIMGTSQSQGQNRAQCFGYVNLWQIVTSYIYIFSSSP